MKDLDKLTKSLASPAYVRDFRPIPFWSWNDKLEVERLTKQIEWMHSCGIGGFFMHARGGLITEYLGEEWMKCCDACCEKAQELDMDAYMYDENGWPSGFVGGKLLEDESNRDQTLSFSTGDYDPAAFVSYRITPDELVRVDRGKKGERYLNVFRTVAVSTVDVLNPEVVEKFLDLTHRAYRERYGEKFAEKIKGFFTDEPQYFRWGTAYTPMLEKYFAEEYGQDVKDGLGLLFAEKRGYEDFRYRYWSALRTLFLRNFARKLYDFCEENGIILTGHYVEESSLGGQMMCCAGVMPYYMYEHIPGIDWLGRGLGDEKAVKQVGSVAAQTGRNRVITESFGCCGWDVTPRELKKILDFQYLGGVNVLCHHLLPYAEYGQRKRDYPQHYTPLNPWINRNFREFNDTYTRLGALIGNSTEEVNACILHPITGAYFTYRRDLDAEGNGIAELERSFSQEVEKIASMHIPHHYVDDAVLGEIGGIDGAYLKCGKCKYRYVILPSMVTVNEKTYGLLHKFKKAGGKIIALGKLPTYIEGHRHDCSALEPNCTLDEVIADQPYLINNAKLRSTIRKCDAGEFVFVINPTDETLGYDISYPGAASVRVLDVENNSYSDPLPLSRKIRPGQSEILFPSKEKPVVEKDLPIVKLSGAQRVVSSTCNTLMIDSAQVAEEGGKFGEEEPLIRAFSRLLDERYAGKLKLKYGFDTEILPRELVLYAEDMNTLSVEVNGKRVESTGSLPDEPKLLAYDIAALVHKGRNDIVIELDYYQSEDVYYALFGEGVTESLRNCMVYNTSLESVYLAGDFGVYPVGLTKGQHENTVRCDGFVLGARKSEIRDLITDGYATFAGSITLESEIECPEGGCMLQVDGRFMTADIEINGKSRTLLFDNAADISDVARPGKNTVRVTLTQSLRNLMGPHHFAPDDEPTGVGPEHFDLRGSWHNGKSKNYRKSYSLVRTSF